MVVKRQVHLMGTIIKIAIVTPLANAEELANEVILRLRHYEQIFSANDDRSTLMRLNHAAGKEAVQVPSELYHLIAIGKEASLYPGGYLNIAIGPLVKLWHIGFSDAHVPTKEQIKEALALTDPHDILLDPANLQVRLKHPGMEIDLGALAKGYSADLIKDFLVQNGVDSGVLNLGGNVVVIGGNPNNADGTWHVGLQNPKKPLGTYIDVFSLRDQSIVTSGVYERNLQVNHHFYHHIFNPQTGYPISTDMASLSIISDHSVDGEIWTSQLFGQPEDKIKAVINNLSNTQAVIITNDQEVHKYSSKEELL